MTEKTSEMRLIEIKSNHERQILHTPLVEYNYSAHSLNGSLVSLEADEVSVKLVSPDRKVLLELLCRFFSSTLKWGITQTTETLYKPKRKNKTFQISGLIATLKFSLNEYNWDEYHRKHVEYLMSRKTLHPSHPSKKFFWIDMRENEC